jgi:hypothetical protein
LHHVKDLDAMYYKSIRKRKQHQEERAMSENMITAVETETETAEDLNVESTEVLNVEDLVGEQTTAYGIHTVLNKIFAHYNLPKIAPQLMYNYARNGLIVKGESVKKNTYTPRTYTKDEVLAFVAKYAANHIARHSK